MFNKERLTYTNLFSSVGVDYHRSTKENFECIVTNEMLERRLVIQRANNKCFHDLGYICCSLPNLVIQQKILDEI